MTHVFHRHPALDLPIAEGGEGPYIIDADGRRYLDASAGAAVSCLGHSHPDVIAAIKDQIDRLPYAHTAFFTNAAMEALADHLIAKAPVALDKVYFVSGGSEAMEAAIKLARQYFLEIGQPERRHLIARRQSYHGNTLGALATGGHHLRRAPYAPLLIDVTHVSPCYAYRDREPDETEEAYAERLAGELEAAIQRAGPETVLAFVAETVVGGAAGALPPVSCYFRRVREVCDRHGILLILDEVMCGMGRTGTLYAFEQEDVVPDLVAIGKGLGAGYQPIGALMVAGRIFDAVRDGTGFFQHGHTYMGHATACAAALAVQRVIERDCLLHNVQRQGAALRTALESRFGSHHNVGDIRGRGLLVALEIVGDRATKAPLDPARQVHMTIMRETLSRGLTCLPVVGTIDGRQGHHVMLAPPFVIDDRHVGEIVEKLGDSVDAALAA